MRTLETFHLKRQRQMLQIW